MQTLMTVTRYEGHEGYSSYVACDVKYKDFHQMQVPDLAGLNAEQAHTALCDAGAKLLWRKGEDPIEGLYALPIKG